MEEKIKKIIAGILGFEVYEISPNSRITNDLGADDLDVVEIIMTLESEFNITISDAEFENKLLRVQNLIDIVLDLTENIKPVRPPSKKTIKKRTVKFTEYTYDDGSVTIKPSTKGFNDMELLGLLTYYFDLFKVNMMRGNAKQD